jgi:hypothetical protein
LQTTSGKISLFEIFGILYSFALLHKKALDCTFTNSTGAAAPLQLEEPA